MPEADIKLDTGMLKRLFAEESVWTTKPSIKVQVTNFKVIPNEAGKRLRLLISDGSFTTHAVIRPEGVEKAESSGLAKSSVITIDAYDIERMGQANKHVVIISDLTVLHTTVGKLGGNLTGIDDYFKSHPEEDLYVSTEAESTPTPEVAAPAAPAATSTTGPQRFAAPQGNKPANLYAIDQLSPYQNTWTIKGRLSYKGDMRTWSNQRGEGKLFNVNFLDETDEIRATAFNENADKFYNLLQEGKVYYVSKARIQPAKPQFSHLKHPYELQMDRDTVIEECQDADGIPKLQYDFVKLSKVQSLEADSIIDVVGVIKEVNPAFQITSKAGKSYDRRDITLVDDSQFAVSVGLWNKYAKEFDIPEGTVVAIKGCKVSDFNGKTLSLTPGASVSANPDTPEAYTIKGWYDAQGRNEQFQSLKSEMTSKKSSLADRKTILEAQNEEIGAGDKPAYFSTKATVNFVKTDNFSYPACLTEGCNRKVTEQGDGTWRCEKCDMNHAVPNYRYILTLSVMDTTGQMWLTLFDTEATTALGVNANEMHRLKEDDPDKFSQTMSQLQMNEYDFRVRAREDNYNGTTRMRYNAVGINKVDYTAEAEFLSQKLLKLST
ncbi:CYFA0S11e04302g1_1 [Cyberlindnera fabianii]|uniref:Replication protein A subunit n=1 Tax=Cyberlindnera fabianii TaxID=36022 RepID=A0A061B8W1_CYBFA|nr:Replication factor A protein 1 [Cyberlindnera fabianii]CDR43335.1 CYFA0S11e04302g1_1 [Cyberlindnera fabianii]